MNKDILKVFRSNKSSYVQLINFDTKNIVWTMNDTKFEGNKTERAHKLGEAIAVRILEEKISSIKFDRNKYKYHGRVKAIAETIREKGVKI